MSEEIKIKPEYDRLEQLKKCNRNLRKRIKKALKNIDENEFILTEMGFDVKKHKAILKGSDSNE